MTQSLSPVGFRHSTEHDDAIEHMCVYKFVHNTQLMYNTGNNTAHEVHTCTIYDRVLWDITIKTTLPGFSEEIVQEDGWGRGVLTHPPLIPSPLPHLHPLDHYPP